MLSFWTLAIVAYLFPRQGNSSANGQRPVLIGEAHREARCFNRRLLHQWLYQLFQAGV